MAPPPPIYLDYAATTSPHARVVDAMREVLARGDGNPASQHRAGQAARKELESCRAVVTHFLGGSSTGMHADRLIFTSGGTEANNLAILGSVGGQPRCLIVSSIEHPSVMGPAEELQRRGAEVKRIPVDADGVIDVDHARRWLKQVAPGTSMSVMLANNETGVVQPVRELAPLCRQQNVALHTDAVQFVAKYSLGLLERLFHDLGVAALTASAHKIHGPVGVGALLLRHDVTVDPQLFGGFQQGGMRPGTESLVLATGFCHAAGYASAHCADWHAQLTTLRDAFERALREQLDDLIINGEAAERLPHISNVAFLGCDRQQLFLALDFEGVYCSTGSACASGSSEPSPVLRAMGLPEEVISSSLRFSFGGPTTREEIDEGVERIVRCVKRLRSQKSARK